MPEPEPEPEPGPRDGDKPPSIAPALALVPPAPAKSPSRAAPAVGFSDQGRAGVGIVAADGGITLTLVPTQSSAERQKVQELFKTVSPHGTLDDELDRVEACQLMLKLAAAEDVPPLTDGQLIAGFNQMDARRRGAVSVDDVQQWHARRKDDSEIDASNMEDMQMVFESYAIYDEDTERDFNSAEEPHEGYLDREGSKLMIKRIVRICGLRPITDMQLETAAKQLDKDGDGNVTLKEFVEWWEQVEWRPSADALRKGEGEDCDRQLRFLFQTYADQIGGGGGQGGLGWKVEDGQLRAVGVEDSGTLDEAEACQLMKRVFQTAQLVPMSEAELKQEFAVMCCSSSSSSSGSSGSSGSSSDDNGGADGGQECCDYEQFAEWWKNLEKWHQPTTEVFNLTEVVKLMTPLRFPIPVIIFL